MSVLLIWDFEFLVANSFNFRQERVFYSAPICKKHDVFTLETTDGVIISLNGTFNKQQAIASGFPDEVLKNPSFLILVFHS